MPQAFTARTPTGISIAPPGRGRAASGMKPQSMMSTADSETASMVGGSVDSLPGPSAATGAVLDFLDRTEMDARVSSSRIREILARPVPQSVSYPSTTLGQSLQTVARLIAGELPTRIYYVSQGGYDTHREQAAQHARLLGDLGDSVNAFVDDLKGQGNLDRVILMGFSEFGRRVTENASGGTDHGAAGLLFLAGSRFSGLLQGSYPSLAPRDLVRGDLGFTLDFRRVYAGLLEHWLKTPSEPVLGGRWEPFRWT